MRVLICNSPSVYLSFKFAFRRSLSPFKLFYIKFFYKVLVFFIKLFAFLIDSDNYLEEYD